MKKNTLILTLVFVVLCHITTIGQTISIDTANSAIEIQQGSSPVQISLEISNTTGSAINDSLLLNLPTNIWYEEQTFSLENTSSTGITLGGNDITNLNQPKFNITIPNKALAILTFQVRTSCEITELDSLFFTYNNVTSSGYIMDLYYSSLTIDNVTSITSAANVTITRDITISESNLYSKLNKIYVTDEHDSGITIDTMVVIKNGIPVDGSSYNKSTGILTIDSTTLYNATGYKYLSSNTNLTVRETLKLASYGDISSTIEVYSGTIDPTDSTFQTCQSITKPTSIVRYSNLAGVTMTADIIQKIGLCQDMIIEYNITNKQNAPIYNLALPLGMAKEESDATQNNKKYADNFWSIKAVSVNGKTINTNNKYIYAKGTSSQKDLTDLAWTIVLNNLTSDPDGSNVGLNDIDGDGCYGDLGANKTTTIRVQLSYSPTYFYEKGNIENTPFFENINDANDSYSGSKNVLKSGIEYYDNSQILRSTLNYYNIKTFQAQGIGLTASETDLNVREGEKTKINFGISASSFDFTNTAFFENGGKVIKEFVFPRTINISNIKYSNGLTLTQEQYSITDSTITIIDTANRYVQRTYLIEATPNVNTLTNGIYHQIHSKLCLVPGSSFNCTDTINFAYREDSITLNILYKDVEEIIQRPLLISIDTSYINRTSFAFLDSNNDGNADDETTHANANTSGVNPEAAKNFQTVDFYLSGVIVKNTSTPWAEFTYSITGVPGTDITIPYFVADSATIIRWDGSKYITHKTTNITTTNTNGECTLIVDDTTIKNVGTLAVGDSLKITIHTTTSEDLAKKGEDLLFTSTWVTQDGYNEEWINRFHLEDHYVEINSKYNYSAYYCNNNLKTNLALLYHAYNTYAFPNEAFGAIIDTMQIKMPGYWAIPDLNDIYYKSSEAVGASTIKESDITVTMEEINGDMYSVFTFVNPLDGSWPIGSYKTNDYYYGIFCNFRADCPNFQGWQFAQYRYVFTEYSYCDTKYQLDTTWLSSSATADPNGIYWGKEYYSQLEEIAPISNDYCNANNGIAKLDVTYSMNTTVSNAWMLLKSDGEAIPDSVITLDKEGNPTNLSYSTTQLGTKNEWYVFLGDIEDDTDYRIITSYTTPGSDKLTVTVGSHCEYEPTLVDDSLVYYLLFQETDTIACYNIETNNTVANGDAIETTLTIYGNPLNLNAELLDTTCIEIGDTINLEITITNQGNTDVSNISLEIENNPNAPEYSSGDNDNEILEIEESWVYTIKQAISKSDFESGSINFSANVKGNINSESEISSEINNSYLFTNSVLLIHRETYATNSNLTVSGNVSTNDTIIDTGIYEIYEQPTNGEVTLNTDGTFTYTANEDFSGNDSFIYSATNNCGKTDTATAFITVTKVEPSISLTIQATDSTCISFGDIINYEISLKNTGSVSLQNISINNTNESESINYNSGDTNNNTLLDSTETWLYTLNYNTTNTSDNNYQATIGIIVTGKTKQGVNISTEVQSLPIDVNYLIAVDDNYTSEETEFTGNLSENDTLISSDYTFQINELPQYGTINLNSNDGTFTYTCSSTNETEDNFRYQLTNQCGTESFANVTISINSNGSELLIPEIFTPNNDGIQDYFRILNIDNYPDATIWIYNRWGQLVYEKNNYGNTSVWGEEDAWWNGYANTGNTQKKNPLPTATYLYILAPNDGSERITGSLFLLP